MKKEKDEEYECVRCGTLVKANDKFCSNCGDNVEEEVIKEEVSITKAKDRMSTSESTIDSADLSASAKVLYDHAYQHNEKGDRDNVYEFSKILVHKYPKSKEAKWALRNFSPLWSADEKNEINIQSYFTFDRGLLHSLVFFLPIWNLVRLVEITKGRTLRPLWIALLFLLLGINFALASYGFLISLLGVLLLSSLIY